MKFEVPHHAVLSPFFLDVTLRDGNQALPRPWNLEQKRQVFSLLRRLNVSGAEVGFAAASRMDFEACSTLAREAPADMIISSLSRARIAEIDASWQALQYASNPRLHIVYPVSPSVVDQVLRCSHADAMLKPFHTLSISEKTKARAKEYPGFSLLDRLKIAF